MRKKSFSFTLLEVVVAMAIIALSTAIAVSAFRGESASRALENAAIELQRYCAQVRFRAAEDGREWAVYFNAEKRTFMAQCLLDHEERELRDSAGETQVAPPRLYWKLSERFEFETPGPGEWTPQNTASDRGAAGGESSRSLEELNEKEEAAFAEDEKADTGDPDEQEFGPKIFHFYADGSAGGGFRLILKCGELSKTFELSPLTGRMIEVIDNEENGMNYSH